MILHRFMSETEYAALMRGEELVNETRHHEEHGQKTTAVGFCFFPEPPEQAVKWLSGVVCTDVCVTIAFPDDFPLTQARATYRDPERDPGANCPLDRIPKMTRTEYCTTRYSTRTCYVLSVTTRFRITGFERMIVASHCRAYQPYQQRTSSKSNSQQLL